MTDTTFPGTGDGERRPAVAGATTGNAHFSDGRLVTPATVTILAVWGIAAALAARAGIFEVSVNGVPVAVVGAVATPIVLFLLAYRMMPSVRSFVAAQDLAILTATQAWRVAGVLFLFLWGYGLLPATFALLAGVGDVAVGLAAAFAAVTVARQSHGWARAASAIVIAGLADFALAFGSGIATGSGNFLHVHGDASSDLVQVLPLSLIPTFLVPVFILLHIMAIIRLRALAAN